MSLILALLYLSRSSILAAPVTTLIGDPSTVNLLTPPEQCLCPSQQRSLWDIVRSCLATLFACSWVSVHPNMPAPGDKSWRISLRRLELMVWTLIAPEMIIFWAMRQWFGARSLAKKYHAQNWTKTHGYFLQMGGFTMYQGETSLGALSPPKMEELLNEGKIKLPKITEQEIQDRSKGDGLSKALAIVQTLWFVLQCIARRAQDLDITELELVTGAFAVLNGIMYFLWWNKPHDVRCSVRIDLLDPPEKASEFAPLLESSPSDAPSKNASSSEPSLNVGSAIKGGFMVLKVIIISPWSAIRAFFSRLGDMNRCSTVGEGKARVPTFYAPANEADRLGRMLTALIAVIFGGIHCAGLVFIFPSRAELILWRVCSIVITGIPLIFFLTTAIVMMSKLGSYINNPSKIRSHPWMFLVAGVFSITLWLGLPIYAIARVLLLVEAFAALRDLPPGAYEVVKWVTFIPHI